MKLTKQTIKKRAAGNEGRFSHSTLAQEGLEVIAPFVIEQRKHSKKF